MIEAEEKRSFPSKKSSHRLCCLRTDFLCKFYPNHGNIHQLRLFESDFNVFSLIQFPTRALVCLRNRVWKKSGSRRLKKFLSIFSAVATIYRCCGFRRLNCGTLICVKVRLIISVLEEVFLVILLKSGCFFIAGR